MPTIASRLAAELQVKESQVQATISLIDSGDTVPFIARYRKEVTGGLDDTQLRQLDERLRYLRELDERCAVIVASVEEQGKLTPELRLAFQTADTKARLEDLYLPYKPKRRTKAQAAREAGLEPLADVLVSDPTVDPLVRAESYVAPEKEVADAQAALEGAKAILSERLSEDADLVARLRQDFWSAATLKAAKGEKAKPNSKFADFHDFDGRLDRLRSHQILALFRGEKEEELALSFVTPEDETPKGTGAFERTILAHLRFQVRGRAGEAWVKDVVGSAWRYRIRLSTEVDSRMRLKEIADAEAIKIFADNVKHVLLSAPGGAIPTMALDPGVRTGVKVAVMDGTGKVVATDVIYPHEPRREWAESMLAIAKLIVAHRVKIVAIGNGTASRETEKLVADLMKRKPDLNLKRAIVSESGASIYSASAYASQELPDLDVTLRGAVSIGRRLQDPLAELVKLDPKSIGVGQYQHDVDQYQLSKALDAVVEDCVTSVGVDVNLASSKLLARVSGLGDYVAQNIVAHRDANGPFPSRKSLLDVMGLGPKAFEQAAGFLRIRGGEEPLDASGVHPEAYPVVRRIVEKTGKDIGSLLGDAKTLRTLRAANFVDEKFGLPTVTDILRELEKPGRDPRPEFVTATFMEGVEEVKDLRPGMILEGTVSSVPAFGCFVDIGVHQDGLVHISAMAKNRVSNPLDVVKPGQTVKVKVLSVDIPRNRIALTLRLDDPLPDANEARQAGGKRETFRPADAARGRSREPATGNAFADAFRKAGMAGANR